MKALSLMQPWATLWAYRKKHNETRPKAFSYKGQLLIHASGTVAPYAKELCETEPFKTALQACGYSSYDELPKMAFIGSTEVTGCGIVKSGKIQLPTYEKALPNELEQLFGDYSEGRYIIFCQNSTAFKEPVLNVKGCLIYGWEVPIEDLNRLLAHC